MGVSPQLSIGNNFVSMRWKLRFEIASFDEFCKCFYILLLTAASRQKGLWTWIFCLQLLKELRRISLARCSHWSRTPIKNDILLWVLNMTSAQSLLFKILYDLEDIYHPWSVFRTGVYQCIRCISVSVLKTSPSILH